MAHLPLGLVLSSRPWADGSASGPQWVIETVRSVAGTSLEMDAHAPSGNSRSPCFMRTVATRCPPLRLHDRAADGRNSTSMPGSQDVYISSLASYISHQHLRTENHSSFEQFLHKSTEKQPIAQRIVCAFFSPDPWTLWTKKGYPSATILDFLEGRNANYWPPMRSYQSQSESFTKAAPSDFTPLNCLPFWPLVPQPPTGAP